LGIEKSFDVPFVAGMALREKQVQQNYRPIIAVHKWFARRPGTLFRALLLSEFGNGSLRESFFESNNLAGVRVLDPFMGGGTPLFEANRLGCDVTGFDINPMAHWIVRQEIETLDLASYRAAAAKLLASLGSEVGDLYRTRCGKCQRKDAYAKYFLWVKTIPCGGCSRTLDLFPGYLISQDVRHPKNVFACPNCGELTESSDRRNPGPCTSCGEPVPLDGPAKRGVCNCRNCGTDNRYPTPGGGPLSHRMFAIEYHCPHCKREHAGRFFKRPDRDDLAKYEEAKARWQSTRAKFVPKDEIPSGDETDRLHRWGYQQYRELFNERQLLGLEMSARLVAKCADERARRALATNLSDLVRYQNMLCRYDTMALKSLDVFSVHGFPVGLVQCESNLLGIASGIPGNGQRKLFHASEDDGGPLVGSGGWANIVDKYAKAKAYCSAPFEVRYVASKKVIVPTPGEWIGDVHPTGAAMSRKVDLRCQSSTEMEFPEGYFDAVLTDPPYFENVQYAELMDFCYVWLRRLVEDDAFAAASTRNSLELTGNETLERDISHFAEGISAVFRRAAKSLKPGGPFAFTYHHNRVEAYFPLAAAILDAGLYCTAVVPCPAEMAASIHINGTDSSIIDTIFVCRSAPADKQQESFSPEALRAELARDLALLEEGGVKVTSGDLRCITCGLLMRWAIAELRSAWDPSANTMAKLTRLASWAQAHEVPSLLKGFGINGESAHEHPRENTLPGGANAHVSV